MCLSLTTIWRCHHKKQVFYRCPDHGTPKCKGEKEQKELIRLLCDKCIRGSKTIKVLDAMFGQYTKPISKRKVKAQVPIKPEKTYSVLRDQNPVKGRDRGSGCGQNDDYIDNNAYDHRDDAYASQDKVHEIRPSNHRNHGDEECQQQYVDHYHRQASSRFQEQTQSPMVLTQQEEGSYYQSNDYHHRISAQGRRPAPPTMAHSQQDFENCRLDQPYDDGLPMQQSRARDSVGNADNHRYVDQVSANTRKIVNDNGGDSNRNARGRPSAHREPVFNVDSHRANNYQRAGATNVSQTGRHSMVSEAFDQPQASLFPRQPNDVAGVRLRGPNTPDSNSETIVEGPGTARRMNTRYVNIDSDSEDDNGNAVNASVNPSMSSKKITHPSQHRASNRHRY